MQHIALALATVLVLGQAEPDPPGARLALCGHSFHMPIAAPLAELAGLAGIKGHTNAVLQSLGGSRVIQHWDLPDEKDRARKAIRAGEVDVLTVSPNMKAPDEGIDKFAALLLEHNPKGRVYVQASWHPGEWLPRRPGFKNEDRDTVDLDELRKNYEPFYAALKEQVRGLNARSQEKLGRPAVFVVPAAHALFTLRERVSQGQVPGVTRPSELFTDATGHGKPPVSALTAYCFFAAIYRRSPVGLPAPKILRDASNPAWDERINRVLQEIAWEAVTQEPLSGVKK
jgi:hypothetical protein